MFTFSLKWIWAQCLLVGAGLHLLAFVAAPGRSHLELVQGTVESVETISRKGLGSFYDLQVRTESGVAQRVLVGRRDVESATMQRLVGRTIAARVNWSGEAYEFTAKGFGELLDEAHASSTARRHDYALAGWIAVVLGVLAGALTLALGRTRTSAA